MDEIIMKLNEIKQEPKQQVQPYFDRLDKLFNKGKIKDDEQKHRFLEIRKLCMVRTYANVEKMLATT